MRQRFGAASSLPGPLLSFKENALRRRTFLATLPLAAAGSSSFAKNVVNSPSPGAVQEAGTARLPKYQAPGDERFERPDVHAGDRPSGASFASRSAALGCSGAAGTAHPHCDAGCDRDAEARRLGCGCGGGGQCSVSDFWNRRAQVWVAIAMRCCGIRSRRW